MKYFLILALCFSSAVMVMSQKCESDDDCEEHQCCVQFLFISRCGDRLNEQSSCAIVENTGKKIHSFLCPCKTGLECVNTKELNIFGHKVPYEPRCLKPEVPETEAPETEAPETEAPETEAPETEPEEPKPEIEAE